MSTTLENELLELKKNLDYQEERKIEEEFENFKKDEADANFITLMSDFVIKTMCLIGNSYVKKGLLDMFGAILEVSMNDYELIDNELAKMNFKSIANKTDLHFVNKDKTHHVNIEMNQFELQTTEGKNNSYLFKIGGEFYSYLKKEDLYKIPIRVEQINLNKFQCPFQKDIPYLYFKLREPHYGFELEAIKIHHIYLPNYSEICYYKDAKEEEKTIAMLNANSYQKLRVLAEGSVERMAIYNMMRKIASKPEFMEFYDKEAYEKAMRDELEELAIKRGMEKGMEKGMEQGIEQGIQKGIQQGIEQGSRQSKFEIAKNMLQENIEKSIISKITGLSLEEIDELQ